MGFFNQYMIFWYRCFQCQKKWWREYKGVWRVVNAPGMESAQILDLKGQLPDTSGSTHLFTYLHPETVIVFWAPMEIAEQAKRILLRI